MNFLFRILGILDDAVNVVVVPTSVWHRMQDERNEAYAVCEQLADWWRKHGIEGTPEIDEIAWHARGVVFRKKGPESP